MTDKTTTERVSDTDLVVTRVFDAPARMVFDAWTTPALMMRWWVPASFGMTFLSCEMDARTGGTYRFVFSHPAFDGPMAFHGRYLEVVPNKLIRWTNEESADVAVTTVTLEEKDGRTTLTLLDRHPTKEALDEAIASGSVNGYPDQFTGLDALLAEG